MPETLTCPACGYLRQPTDTAPPWQCPHCQKAYNKTARTVPLPIAPIIAEPVPVPPQPINFTGADLLNYDKFIGMLNEMDARLEKLVAREFSDPLVLQTGWLPVNRTSANFRTHELKEVSPGRLEFCATTTSRWFSITLMLLGVGEAVFYLHLQYRERSVSELEYSRCTARQRAFCRRRSILIQERHSGYCL